MQLACYADGDCQLDVRSNYECGKKVLMDNVLSDDDIRACFPQKKAGCHKGDFGALLILGGSKNYVGAPLLAYMGAAALRMGSGLVRIAIPQNLYPVVADKVTDATLFVMPEKSGHIKFDKRLLINAVENTTAVICGMGIGNSRRVYPVLRWLMKNVKSPLLLDADALNILSKNLHWLKLRGAPTILTPHIKEMARLTGLDKEYIKNNKESTAMNFADQYKVTVVLKDNVSIITEGKSITYNHAGTPAMAKGGSGDLLAGIIGGLLARGILPYSASAAGAYIAGRSAELAVRDNNEYSLLPSETATYIEKWLTKLLIN